MVEASSSGIWPVQVVAGMLANPAHDAVPTADSSRRQEEHATELISADAWARLIGQISAIARHGGGRVLIRCVPSEDLVHDKAEEFYVTIGAERLAEQKQVASDRTAQGGRNLQPVRIVTDPNAPALQPQDVDRLYPWRQKDLLRELNRRLGRRMLTSYDIQAIRRQHHLDDRPDFIFNLPGAGRRYSPAIADWIMQEQTRDPEFFRRVRLADHDLMAARRRKPR
jgi:hypothetical protein